MKDILVNINKIFESKVRLGVMALLIVEDAVDFNTLKEMLDITDGNLASHIAVLEKNKYLKVNKKFMGKKPHTSYTITQAGRKAFQDHLDAMEELIKKTI